MPNPDLSPARIAERVFQVLRGLTNDEVAIVLSTEADFDVSSETVRRYRGGGVQRIDAAFVGAVALSYGADGHWLLTGRQGAGNLRKAIDLLWKTDSEAFERLLLAATLESVLRYDASPSPEARVHWLDEFHALHELRTDARSLTEEQLEQVKLSARRRLASVAEDRIEPTEGSTDAQLQASLENGEIFLRIADRLSPGLRERFLSAIAKMPVGATIEAAAGDTPAAEAALALDDFARELGGAVAELRAAVEAAGKAAARAHQKKLAEEGANGES